MTRKRVFVEWGTSLFAAIIGMDLRMVKESLKRWWRPGGVFAISLMLHGAVAAVLLLSFQFEETPPPPEAAVEVTLVAPPEEPPPEMPAEEVPAPAPEPPPPPPPEEQAAETPPPPEPAPEPEPEPEPEPPAPVPPAPEAETEPQLPDASQAPIPVLRPVVRFAEEDSGPEISPGTEADSSLTPDSAARLEEADKEPAATVAQPEIELPEATLAEDAPMPDAADETVTGEGEVAALAEPAPETTPDEAEPGEGEDAPSEQPNPAAEAALVPREVKKLFSTAISGEKSATAMAGLSRQERGDQLCGTELSQQLRQGQPSYAPYLLPILRLKEGNVVDVSLAAFREVGGAWINIAVRCEVNANATEVISFSLSIGKPVPRTEWRQRGFPES